MLTLKDVADYIRTFDSTAKIYQGFIDRNEEKCISVFKRANEESSVAVGGKANMTYAKLCTAILVHWTDNTETCENKANSLFEFLLCKTDVIVNSKLILSIKTYGDSPIDIQRDEKNICEMVIHADFYYER